MQSDPRETDPRETGAVSGEAPEAPAGSETVGVPESRDLDASRARAEEGGPAVAPGAGPAAPPSTAPLEIEHHPDEERIREDIIGVIRTIYDPEIPVNIYDIGLIYSIDVDTASRAYVKMTLTSPMCPVAGSLPAEVEMKVGSAPGVSGATVELVWDPPWGIDKMSESARLQLNL